VKPSKRGGFVTLEGIEGAGKSTQMEVLVRRLTNSGETVVVTREPGGTALGEKLRGVLLDPDIGHMAAETELLLIFAARAEHLAQIIRPHLEQGSWVLCDRFTDASFAYQGAGRGLGSERVEILETWLQGTLRPDLVIILDVPVEVGLQRAVARGKRDRIENEDVSFFERARSAYLERARLFPQRYRVIDGAQDLDNVTADLMRTWDAWFQDQAR